MPTHPYESGAAESYIAQLAAAKGDKGKALDIQKVEIVKPLQKGERSAVLVGSLIGTGLSVLLVWWTLAAWVPELGITYWQTILPVFAFRSLFGGVKSWRYTTKKEETK